MNSESRSEKLKTKTLNVFKARPIVDSVNKLFTSKFCKSGEWHGPVTDHFDGSRFCNYYPDERHFAPDKEFTKWWLTRRQERISVLRVNEDAPDLKEKLAHGEWECTLINHATHLIRFQGINILTDPVLSDRPSPFQFVGPKRRRPAAFNIHTMPRIDVVVISHDHYDHLDLNTLGRLNEHFAPLFIVPIGNGVLLKSEGLTNVVELDWWEHFTVKGTDIYLTPARHYSARYRGKASKNKTLWGGYFLKHHSGASVYFCGDTAWTKSFADIRERLGAPDAALLSTGAYKPRHLMQYCHMSPHDAVLAHKTLESRQSIAFHYGTWRLTDESSATMRKDLQKALLKEGVEEERFVAPNNGKTTRGLHPKAHS